MHILPGIYLANGFAYQQHQNSYLVVGDGGRYWSTLATSRTPNRLP